MRSFFFSSRRRHTRLQGDWSSDVCSSDLMLSDGAGAVLLGGPQALPQAPGLRLKLRWTHLRSFAGDYPVCMQLGLTPDRATDRKSTRLNSSHLVISYAVFCLKKKKKTDRTTSGRPVIMRVGIYDHLD